MKPLSEHLVALIAAAEEIVRAPHDVALSVKPGFAEVAAAIRHAHGRPAEGIRTTYAGINMLNAIEAFSAAGDDRWQMQIGVLLPLLRNDAYQALRNEIEARQETRQGERFSR